MLLQPVSFGGAELGIDAVEFALHFRVGSHRAEVGFPRVATAGYSDTGVMDEAFQKDELSFRRQARKLVFDFVEGWRCHRVVIF